MRRSVRMIHRSPPARHDPAGACGDCGFLALVSTLYFLIAVISAVPAFLKHSHHVPLLVFGYGALLAVVVLCVIRVARWPVPDWFAWIGTFVILLLFAVAACRLYPATRLLIPRSSAPDALITPATRLLAGTNPYGAPVGLDAVPASPGAAWILVHAPLTVSGLIWLVSVGHLALLSIVVGITTRSGRAALSVVVLMIVLPAFLQASLTGHDLFAAGCALTSVTIALFGPPGAPPRPRWLLWVAAGVVATARAPLVLAVAMLAALLWWNRQQTWRLASGIAFGVVAVTHAVCWAWAWRDGVVYQPLHVFHRAGGAGPWWLAGGALLTCCATVAVFRSMRRPASRPEWLLVSWVALGMPFAFVGAVELYATAGTLGIAAWEGKNYVSYLTPLLVTALVVKSAASLERGQPLRPWPQPRALRSDSGRIRHGTATRSSAARPD